MGIAIAVQAVRGVVASDCALGKARYGRYKVTRRTREIGHRLFSAAQAGGIAALLVTAAPLAFSQGQGPGQGQNAAASAPQSSPSPTTPAAPVTTAAGADSSSSAAGSTSTDSSKSEPVCFKLTGHCVDASKAPAGTKSGTAAGKTDAQTKRKKLNLTAPDVRTVVPEQELKEPLPSEKQITEVQEAQTVSVKTDEGVPPDVPLGLGAIWWAVVHPSQAWRILTPAE